MSWFWRGAQSAVFYYLSCTPWFSYLNERKRERERNQAKAAKAREDVETGAYLHPLPSDTNPFWNEEVAMGPGLKRGRVSKEKAKSESTKRLTTSGQDSSAGESSTSTFPSLDVMEKVDIVDDAWNKKKYQRADEHLWGADDLRYGSYASLSSRAANKPLVSGDGAYYNARNPAVSELHPPIISNRPKHSSQALWMTQPPPPAKLMEGKERADRSRSVSNASYGSARGTGGAMAGRQASLRRLKGKVYDDLPDNLDPSPPEDDGEVIEEADQQQRRNRSTSDPLYTGVSTKQRPSPGSPQANGRLAKSTIVRPNLSTVNSINQQDLSKLQTPTNHARSVSPASSLQALQDLIPTTIAMQKIQIPAPSSKEARNTRLPLPTELEEQFLKYSFPPSTPGMLGTPGIDDHVLAPTQIQQQWSMDI